MFSLTIRISMWTQKSSQNWRTIHLPTPILRRAGARFLASLADSESPVASVSQLGNAAARIDSSTISRSSRTSARPPSHSRFSIEYVVMTIRSFRVEYARCGCSPSSNPSLPERGGSLSAACMFCLRVCDPDTLDRAFTAAAPLDSWTFRQWRQNV